jgi:hypothetical protein
MLLLFEPVTKRGISEEKFRGVVLPIKEGELEEKSSV